MPEYKLSYFDGMGLGEPIRLIFHYMNQPFQDNRIKFEQWPQMKKEMPWGKMPMLLVDGKAVCQSNSICRYLGKKAGLSGKDDWESLQIDMLADCAQDMRQEFSNYFRERDEKLKEEKKTKLFNETAPYYFAKFDQQIKNNKGFLVNGQMSWADIMLCSFLQMFNAVGKKDVTEGYPNLKALLDKFVNHPKLKEYIANRPKTDF